MTQKETILITGGTSLVGRAVIPRLITDGYNVVFTSRRSESKIEGAKCIGVDLLHDDGVASLLSALDKEHITINHIIHNFRDIDNLKTDEYAMPTQEQWLREYQAAVSVPASITATLANSNSLRSVINITSIYGIVSANLQLYEGDQRAAPIHYNVAKAAQIHLTKELSVRLAPKSIRVNAVAYGGIKGRADDNFENRYDNLCPLDGMLNAEDLSGAISFLLSEKDSAKITGQTLQVDGGWTLW